MKVFTITIFTFYLISFIICHAACPCHIPCTGEMEVCTCFGPCDDDGYGCRSHGDDYEFFDQILCMEGKWQVQCIRHAKCDQAILDDTNPYAAYKELSSKLTLIDDDDSNANEDEEQSTLNSAHSMSWFGGNWFDFFGQNKNDFFENDIDNKFYNDLDSDEQISIDNKNYDSNLQLDPQYSQSSSQRTLKVAAGQSDRKQEMDDLGRNAAGYQIIALPLYILIICIISSALLGMLMCAGFVYCGLNCCCPLPPASPTLTASQRSNEVHMARMLQSFTLSRRSKSDSDINGGGIYKRMHIDALHNPTNDDRSIRSVSPLGIDDVNPIINNDIDGNYTLNNDEYANDSEDDHKKDPFYPISTPHGGNDSDSDHVHVHGISDDYDMKDNNKSLYALNGNSFSDIDNDSYDEDIIDRYTELINNNSIQFAQIDIISDDIKNNDDDDNEGVDDDDNDSISDLSDNVNNQSQIYEENDELEPLKKDKNIINDNNDNDDDKQQDNGDDIVTVEHDDDDDDQDIDEQQQELKPILKNKDNGNLP